ICPPLHLRGDLLSRQRGLYRVVLGGPPSAGHVLYQFGAGTLHSGAVRYCARGRRGASRDSSFWPQTRDKLAAHLSHARRSMLHEEDWRWPQPPLSSGDSSKKNTPPPH